MAPLFRPVAPLQLHRALPSLLYAYNFRFAETGVDLDCECWEMDWHWPPHPPLGPKIYMSIPADGVPGMQETKQLPPRE